MERDDKTVTNAEFPPPLFYREIGKSPIFTMIETARFTARPDEDVTAVRNRYQNLIRRGLIHRVFDADARPNDPARLAIGDVAAAHGVILPLFDVGIADAEIAGYASRACYGWDDTINPRPAYIPDYVSPIVAAMVGAARGKCWAFKLSTFHNDQTNARRVTAAVYDMDVPPPDASQILPPSYLPRVTLTILLPPLLLPLNRALALDKPKGD